ncbi:hypothetical protein F8388_026131 [Cannabis sativa]|uniref:DUF1985 domain-containing protein n=1 Tax=Cannabis sativa TaxID=3483 RepID=A0A7J6G011_CANSA|nr:hypothetical protein F8388_026131 [Cannabis sativa]
MGFCVSVLSMASDDDFQTEKVVPKLVSSKKRKDVSDDAICEPNVTDDQKLVNVAKKVKKNPVSKSHGKKKSEAPSVDGPLFLVFLFVVGNQDDVELWFKLGDKAVRFEIEEFSIITGLDCTKFYDVDLFKSKKLLAYKEGIFCMHGLTEKLTVKEVASVFFSGALKDDEDYVKIALVYFFAGYLYGYPQGKKIDNFIFAMVNGDDYIEVFNRFGWGKLLWEKTFHHLKIALKDVNNTLEQLAKKKIIEKGYKLKGFPIAFLIWLYEIILISNKIPRVLNWENSPTTEFSELIQGVFNNPKIFVKDFVALSGEKSQSLFSKFKSDPKYVPKRIGGDVSSDEVNDEVKLDQICVEINSIKECQQQIKDGIFSLRIEFLSEFAKLAEIINGLKKEENDGSSKDSELFSSPIRERQPKPSSVVLSPYVVDFGSSSSSKEDLMRIVQDDKFIVHGINPFKDEIGYNTGVEQCIKFSKFIDENIVMNRGVKKYSYADNILSPPIDFSFIEISEKMWFYQLHACGEFLCDSHLDVVFYYLRKKIKQYDTLNQMITTTDCLFDQVIWNSYNQFLKSGSNPSKIDFDNKQKHWILVDFDIKERMLNIYNPMSGALNKKRALDHVKAYSTMLPFYLEYLDVYSSRSDLNLVQGPYSVGKREPLNFKFIDGLPMTVECVIKFAEFFIRGKIDDIPAKMSYCVAVYRDDLAVSLFIHARRKQIGGYITDDEVLKKGKKSKDNASVKAKTCYLVKVVISVRNWFFMMIKKQIHFLFILEMHIFGVDRCFEVKNSFSALRLQVRA